MKKKTKVKKHRPTDSTMRNVRAANKKITTLEMKVVVLCRQMIQLYEELNFVGAQRFRERWNLEFGPYHNQDDQGHNQDD